MKDPTTQREAAINKDYQVKSPSSKLYVLASAIDVSPLDVDEPLRETTRAETPVIEKVAAA